MALALHHRFWRSQVDHGCKLSQVSHGRPAWFYVEKPHNVSEQKRRECPFARSIVPDSETHAVLTHLVILTA